MTQNRQLITATRESLNVNLDVKQGAIPSDWYGYVYINSPAGTVNSNGLPFPSGSQESGSPIMNGDGYVFRFDLSPSAVGMQTELMKPPCYYADLATRFGNSNNYDALYHFHNWGITRVSLELGSRNELNTAITPFRFKGDAGPRILACYDAGRPWEIDPVSLELITPIGANSEWTMATPSDAFPFAILQSTAHPSFDPLTKELFTVNFTKSLKTIIDNDAIVEMLKKDIAKVEQVFRDAIGKLNHLDNIDDILKEIERNIASSVVDEEKKVWGWIKGLFTQGHLHRQQTNSPVPGSPPVPSTPTENDDASGETDEVYLLRWDGTNGPLNKWKVLDETGKPLQIIQCMHQTTLTQDYIVLADATFKFALDILFNHPFNSTEIDNFLRKFLTVQQLPYLDVYIIKRSDLNPASQTVQSKKLQQPIPLEAIHFTANYSNPNGMITLHLAHNSAACLAEWVRTFDKLPPDGTQPVKPEVVGLISVGDMDIGRIGKVVIDANQAVMTSQNYIVEKGNLNNPQNLGPHTWGVGLYTFRDIISPDNAVPEIKHIYWSCYGLDPRLLTKYVYDLYYHYQNRIIPVDEMLKLSQQGIPFVLCRQNVSTMTLEDSYQFPNGAILKSVQFVPKKNATPGLDPQMDGYIFTTEVVNYPNANGDNYQCEIWIFDAAKLSSGPVCVLNHPQLDYAFTLHSVWMDTAVSSGSSYKINIKSDYDPLIQKLAPALRQKPIQDLFDKFVYPSFGV